MMILLSVLACASSETATEAALAELREDAGACEGPTIEAFAESYAVAYCEWAAGCSNGPDDIDACIATYTDLWLNVSGAYQACRAQECLDAMAEVPECARDTKDWDNVDLCQYDHIYPGVPG